ncbi:MAG: hypothetical protein VZR36_06330 [Prevotella sp.]|nr:hypothetical protein [Prevotella sp.]
MRISAINGAVYVNSMFYPCIGKGYKVGDTIKSALDDKVCAMSRNKLGAEVVHSYVDTSSFTMQFFNNFGISISISTRDVVVKCEIPEGVPYWEGMDGNGIRCYGSLCLEIKEIYTKVYYAHYMVNGIYFFSHIYPQCVISLDEIILMAKRNSMRNLTVEAINYFDDSRSTIYDTSEEVTKEGKKITREVINKMKELEQCYTFQKTNLV